MKTSRLRTLLSLFGTATLLLGMLGLAGTEPAQAAGGQGVELVAPPFTRKPYFHRMTLTPSLSGAKRGDVLLIDTEGDLWRYTLDAKSISLTPRVRIGTGWYGLWIIGPGDWDGDGKADIIAVDYKGNMYLYPGNGNGGLVASKKKQIGSGWTGYKLTAVGDWTKDGKPDLLACHGVTGDVWVYPGDGKGGFKSPRIRVASGWNYVVPMRAGDVNKDGNLDIWTDDWNSNLWMHAGTGNNTFRPRVQVGSGWGTYDEAGGADINGDGLYDIVAMNWANGNVYLYPGTGTKGEFGARSLIAAGWDGY
ncbi:MAG: VCBS repeat-containing protein [Micrococcales bacterium]|nr:VCBS repeat-containing protein [Micrococcales bacterium]